MAQNLQATFAKLDPANDDHWTHDGLPKLSVVQKLASDQSIKLRDIQATGFVRPNAPQAANTDFDATDPVEHTGVNVNAPQADPAAQADPATPEQGEFLTEDEVHEILSQRVADAEQALKDARAKQAEGHREEIEAMAAINAARTEFTAAFPPLTDAENRKLYIASENAKRAERAGYGAPASRVDAAMGRSNSRGWRRPVRGITGADGSLIKNADGSVAIPRPMQVRRQALPSQMGGR
jgi:hypothetical protein